MNKFDLYKEGLLKEFDNSRVSDRIRFFKVMSKLHEIPQPYQKQLRSLFKRKIEVLANSCDKKPIKPPSKK